MAGRRLGSALESSCDHTLVSSLFIPFKKLSRFSSPKYLLQRSELLLLRLVRLLVSDSQSTNSFTHPLFVCVFQWSSHLVSFAVDYFLKGDECVSATSSCQAAE